MLKCFASGAATARISCSLNFSPPVAMNLFIARRQLALNPDFVYGRFRHHQGIQTKCATPQTLFYSAGDIRLAIPEMACWAFISSILRYSLSLVSMSSTSFTLRLTESS